MKKRGRKPTENAIKRFTAEHCFDENGELAMKLWTLYQQTLVRKNDVVLFIRRQEIRSKLIDGAPPMIDETICLGILKKEPRIIVNVARGKFDFKVGKHASTNSVNGEVRTCQSDLGHNPWTHFGLHLDKINPELENPKAQLEIVVEKNKVEVWFKKQGDEYLILYWRMMKRLHRKPRMFEELKEALKRKRRDVKNQLLELQKQQENLNGKITEISATSGQKMQSPVSKMDKAIITGFKNYEKIRDIEGKISKIFQLMLELGMSQSGRHLKKKAV